MIEWLLVFWREADAIGVPAWVLMLAFMACFFAAWLIWYRRAGR